MLSIQAGEMKHSGRKSLVNDYSGAIDTIASHHVYRKYMSPITTDRATKTNDQGRHYTPLLAHNRAQVYDLITRRSPKMASTEEILLKLG
jgi:hypothetical protein